MASRASFQSPAPFSAQPMASTSSLVTPTLALLADPPVRQVDAAAMDYLLIEMVQTLRESEAVSSERLKKAEDEMIQAGFMPPTVAAREKQRKEKEKREKEKLRESTGSGAGSPAPGGGAGKGSVEEDAAEEGLRTRLEAIGVHVGGNIAERLCRERPRFTDTLDAVKFVCKDIWSICWDKQVDNLRTNHRGVYVLQDNQFKPICRISSYEGQQDAQRRARTYVALPAGIIKGAFARLGFDASITPEIPHLPQCKCQTY
ncbi:transport protein particle component [Schizopora paradoxa]|uniref:Transport protein particle component n=1 Tax=Schizopora paradoxa TaxID=27342 RepID=A0A0H2S181_9AGAM|nr:transport protein particle component [Schizopora paradoxa]